MKIDITSIYEKNILNHYNEVNREMFRNDFTIKQQEMWRFTLDLIKDGFPKNIYDSVLDRKYLEGYLELHLSEIDSGQFTIEEWFDYMKSKE